MKMRWLSGIVAGLILLGIVGLAQASFTHVGFAIYEVGSKYEAYGLIYDDDLQLIWMDYVNPPAIWQDQMDWAEGLNGHEDFAGLWLEPGVAVTWAGLWRLPHHDEYRKLANSEVWHKAPDDNLFAYWRPYTDYHWSYLWTSDSEDERGAWVYSVQFNSVSTDGLWEPELKSCLFSAVGVRPGRVAAVPLPAPILLLASALAGLVTIRRNRARRL